MFRGYVEKVSTLDLFMAGYRFEGRDGRCFAVPNFSAIRQGFTDTYVFSMPLWNWIPV